METGESLLIPVPPEALQELGALGTAATGSFWALLGLEQLLGSAGALEQFQLPASAGLEKIGVQMCLGTPGTETSRHSRSVSHRPGEL